MDNRGLEPGQSGEPAQAGKTPTLAVSADVPRSDYDSARADAMVRFPGCLTDGRFWQLGFAFLNFVIASFLLLVFPDKNHDDQQRLRERAVAVRKLLEDLGPTFVKLGQFLSVRGDIIPEEFAKELTLLQDRVPPFKLEQVRETIRLDLGGNAEDIFLEFENEPMASASIGQVHRVRLKEGGWAVVKVQRPGLSGSFYRDLGLMRLMARWWAFVAKLGFTLGVERKNAAMPGSQRLTGHRPLDMKDWLELSDEFGHTLFSEIDYLKEGRNADKLRRAVRSKPHIRVPRVHWRYTGRHVLTLEYIPGIKISEVDELNERGFDLEQVGNMLVNCYLEQFVLTGFFHADPHAGNLAIDDFGRLIIYDFGMMGQISETQRRALLQCVIAVVRREPKLVTTSLMELGIVSKSASAEAVSRAISPFIDYYAGKDIMDLDFRHLEADIDKVVADRSFRLPPDLAYLLRAGSSLEGIARGIKPDFSFVEAVRPVMTKWALHQGIESLAKSGKLLEFAGFAFNEWRASMRPDKATADVSSDDDAKQSLLVRIKTQGKPQQEAAKELKAVPEPACEPAKCFNCQTLNHEVSRLQSRAKEAQAWLLVWFVLSFAAIITLASVASFHSGHVSLYFLIGLCILGAFIFWKFTKLLK